jgi:glycolate oxidase iron-sulfur subunit
MQTSLAEEFLDRPESARAQAILRACVHCGFCAAACPTYQLTGDELDGPRGRIYLIKQMLEGQPVSALTQVHLDRCLSCGACETVCPSGVQYRQLLDFGRDLVQAKVRRPWRAALLRRLLLEILPDARRFSRLMKLARILHPWLPRGLRRHVQPPGEAGLRPMRAHARRMLMLEGCVQPSLAPRTNAAAARVLDRLGIGLVAAEEAGCCGAISQHLAAVEQAQAHARHNIDAWWPQIAAGVEAIVTTASGCGLLVKEYGQLLQDDPRYAEKAARVATLTKDLAEVLAGENLEAFADAGKGRRIAFQSPCSMQHGQGLHGVAETILRGCGYVLSAVADSHQCCGSAGTYSILQPRLSKQLLKQKLTALMTGQPECIATANIGCQMHMARRAKVPVRHWIELLEP